MFSCEIPEKIDTKHMPIGFMTPSTQRHVCQVPLRLFTKGNMQKHIFLHIIF